MNQVPIITVAHLDAALKTVVMHNDGKFSVVDVFNAAQKLADQNQEQYITADDARKLGAGNAEWSYNGSQWDVCCAECKYREIFNGGLTAFKYRAIKQPEPVEPHQFQENDNSRACDALCESQAVNMTYTPVCVETHAKLKAMYEQQEKNTAEGKAGGLEDFVWRYSDDNGRTWGSLLNIYPSWKEDYTYECTPKPTCQIKNLDTGELKTMTRDAAKKLQAETKDVCDWRLPNNSATFKGCMDFYFDQAGIYTYKQKKNLVKLNGKLMTRDAATTEWNSKKDTCDCVMTNSNGTWTDNFPIFDSDKISYAFRPKPPKQETEQAVKDARKPLSAKDLDDLHHIEEFGLFCSFDEFEQIARAIENKHGIKELLK